MLFAYCWVLGITAQDTQMTVGMSLYRFFTRYVSFLSQYTKIQQKAHYLEIVKPSKERDKECFLVNLCGKLDCRMKTKKSTNFLPAGYFCIIHIIRVVFVGKTGDFAALSICDFCYLIWTSSSQLMKLICIYHGSWLYGFHHSSIFKRKQSYKFYVNLPSGQMSIHFKWRKQTTFEIKDLLHTYAQLALHGNLSIYLSVCLYVVQFRDTMTWDGDSIRVGSDTDYGSTRP